MSLEIVDHEGLMLLVAASAMHSDPTSPSTTQTQAVQNLALKRAPQETVSSPGKAKKAKTSLTGIKEPKKAKISPPGIKEPNALPVVKPLVCAHGSHIY